MEGEGGRERRKEGGREWRKEDEGGEGRREGVMTEGGRDGGREGWSKGGRKGGKE